MTILGAHLRVERAKIAPPRFFEGNVLNIGSAMHSIIKTRVWSKRNRAQAKRERERERGGRGAEHPRLSGTIITLLRTYSVFYTVQCVLKSMLINILIRSTVNVCSRYDCYYCISMICNVINSLYCAIIAPFLY